MWSHRWNHLLEQGPAEQTFPRLMVRRGHSWKGWLWKWVCENRDQGVGSACGHPSSLSHVWLFVTPRTVAHRAPLSMGFSRPECWSGLPFPPPVWSQRLLQKYSAAGPKWLTAPGPSAPLLRLWLQCPTEPSGLRCLPQESRGREVLVHKDNGNKGGFQATICISASPSERIKNKPPQLLESYVAWLRRWFTDREKTSLMGSRDFSASRKEDLLLRSSSSSGRPWSRKSQWPSRGVRCRRGSRLRSSGGAWSRGAVGVLLASLPTWKIQLLIFWGSPFLWGFASLAQISVLAFYDATKAMCFPSPPRGCPAGGICSWYSADILLFFPFHSHDAYRTTTPWGHRWLFPLSLGPAPSPLSGTHPALPVWPAKALTCSSSSLIIFVAFLGNFPWVVC